jgi:hypothetical protein
MPEAAPGKVTVALEDFPVQSPVFFPAMSNTLTFQLSSHAFAPVKTMENSLRPMLRNIGDVANGTTIFPSGLVATPVKGIFSHVIEYGGRATLNEAPVVIASPAIVRMVFAAGLAAPLMLIAVRCGGHAPAPELIMVHRSPLVPTLAAP